MNLEDMAGVLPTPLSWITVGLMAITFIVFAKFVVTKWNVPYVGDFIKSV